MKESELPLEGVRVLDLTTSYAGPFCAMLLADMGADVVKVEEPINGDDSRYWGPPFYKGISPWFLSANRNKRGISLNIRNQKGIEILKELVRKADIFIISLGLKTREELGLTYEVFREINPGLIYCSITGFGLTGPYRYRPCYDLISEGIGGIMGVTGDNDHPEKVGTAAGDILAAHNACLSIVSCLYRREHKGQGELIDVCLVDSVVSFVSPRIVSYLATGELPRPDGNRSSPIAVYQPIRTRDGYLNMGIGNDRIWTRVCELLGLEDLLEKEELKTNEGRKVHRAKIVSRLEEILMTRETKYWFDFLSEKGVPCGPIYYLDNVVEDPHIQSRGMIFELEDEELDRIPQVNSPWKLTQTRDTIYRSPPRIGQHDDEVYQEWLGLTPSELKDLRRAGVIRRSNS